MLKKSTYIIIFIAISSYLSIAQNKNIYLQMNVEGINCIDKAKIEDDLDIVYTAGTILTAVYAGPVISYLTGGVLDFVIGSPEYRVVLLAKNYNADGSDASSGCLQFTENISPNFNRTYTKTWCSQEKTLRLGIISWENDCGEECARDGCDSDQFAQEYNITYSDIPYGTWTKQYIVWVTADYVWVVTVNKRWTYNDNLEAPKFNSSASVNLCPGNLLTISGSSSCPNVAEDFTLDVYYGNPLISTVEWEFVFPGGFQLVTHTSFKMPSQTYNLGSKQGVFDYPVTIPPFSSFSGSERTIWARLVRAATAHTPANNESPLSAAAFVFHPPPSLLGIDLKLADCKGKKGVELKFNIIGYANQFAEPGNNASMIDGYSISIAKISSPGNETGIGLKNAVTMTGTGSKTDYKFTTPTSNYTFTIDAANVESMPDVELLTAGTYGYQLKNYYGSLGAMCYIEGTIIVPEPYDAFQINTPTLHTKGTSEYHTTCTYNDAEISATATHTATTGVPLTNSFGGDNYYVEGHISGKSISGLSFAGNKISNLSIDASKEATSVVGYTWSKNYRIYAVDNKGCKSENYVTANIAGAKKIKYGIEIIYTSLGANLSNFNSYGVQCHYIDNGSITGYISPSRGNVSWYEYKLHNTTTNEWKTQNVPYVQNSTFSSLANGTYDLYVKDALGCVDTLKQITLNEPSPIAFTTLSLPGHNTTANEFYAPAKTMSNSPTYHGYHTRCHGSTDGFLQYVATTASGLEHFTFSTTQGSIYSVNSTSGTAVFHNLPSHTPLTFTVTDRNGCTTTTSLTLTHIPPPLTVTSKLKRQHAGGFHTGCHTGNVSYNPSAHANGQVTIAGTGGIASLPYTATYKSYLHPNSGNTRIHTLTGIHSHTFANLTHAGHTYTITDDNKCSLQDTFWLRQPPLLTFTGYTPIMPSCYYYENGSATLTVTGGAPGLKIFEFYQTAQVHNGMGGQYKNPAYYDPFTTTTTGLYATAIAMDAGTYTGVVTDLNECYITHTHIIVPEPQPIDVAKHGGIVACAGGTDGKVAYTCHGGTAPYITLLRMKDDINNPWRTFTGTAFTVTGLRKNQYDLQVTDAHGCYNLQLGTLTGYSTVPGLHFASLGPLEVTGPKDPLTATLTITSPPQCHGYRDGAVNAQMHGGWVSSKPQYAYMALNDSTQYHNEPSKAFGSLAAGYHTLYVKEVTSLGGACYAQARVYIAQPQPLSLSGYSHPVLCHGGATGKLIVTATGGNLPYTYTMPGVGTATRQGVFTGLGVGSYTATVIDANHCPVTSINIQVTQPQPLSTLVRTDTSTCRKADGGMTVAGQGGVRPYRLTTIAGAFHAQALYTDTVQLRATQLRSGLYRVLLTDANLCTHTMAGFVTDRNGPTVAGMLSKPASCHYRADGEVKLNLIKMTSPLAQAGWVYTDTVSRSTAATGLYGGHIYSGYAIDSDGCLGADTVYVPMPEPFVAGVNATSNPVCYRSADGSMVLTATGGTLPYKVQWAHTPQPYNTLSISGLNAYVGTTPQRSYAYTALDYNLCTATGQATLYNPQPVKVSLVADTALICEGQYYTLDARRNASSYLWQQNGNAVATTRTAPVSVSGMYKLTLTDSLGCIGTDSIKLRTSKVLLEARFGKRKYVQVGDSIVLVEISWPAPSKIDWYIPKGLHVVRKWAEYALIVPDSVGSYKVGLRATLADCADQVWQTIIVAPRTDSSNLRSDPFFGYKGIETLEVWPNPATEEVNVKITLAEPGNCEVRLYGLVAHEPLYAAVLTDSKKYKHSIDISHLPRGIYILSTTTAESNKWVKVMRE
ncbi:MAG: T9SS type A sorting domain-containing protein [Cytophagales bacterium]|nr:T9SS type A sorting domain-containing protein [Cytophagales bacterium]